MEETEKKDGEEATPRTESRGVSHEPLFGFLMMLIIVIFLLSLATYGGWLLYRGVKESRGDMSRVSIEQIPLGMNTGEQQKEPKETEERKAVENTTVKTEPVVVNKKVAVKVLNGGAPKGSASIVAGVLMGSGYATVGTGNATGDYTGVTVFFKAPATDADANAVKDALLKKYPGAVVKPSVPGTADTVVSPITVITGK